VPGTKKTGLLLSLLVLLLGALAPSPADAAPLYKIMGGPKWPKASTPASGRMLDCRASNLYFHQNGFALDLKSSGGCFFELVTSTDLVVERRVPSPDCAVTVQGFVGFRATGVTCVLEARQSLLVSYTSRVPNTNVLRTNYFQASASFHPKSFFDPFSRYLRQVTIDLKGGSPTDTTGVGTISDTLVATFVSPLPASCPNLDSANAVAYVKDIANDTLGSNPGASGAVAVAYGSL
jgi:hypothetical protein